MQNKNSKSESYIVREAEGIIEKYVANRELSNIKSYYQLKNKYQKLKILTIAILITFFIGITFNIIF